MHAPHLVRTIEIGNRSSEFQNAVKPSRGKMQTLRCIPDQGKAAGVRLGYGLYDIGGRSGIRQNPRQIELSISRNLTIPGGGNPFRDLFRALGRRREHQIGGSDRWHLNVKIDAVE
jgi:hypothetical protein